MARLEHSGVELQRISTGHDVWFEFVDGGPSDAVFTVEGMDHVIVGKSGRFVGSRRADVLPIILVGWVEGQGTTHAEKREDYFALMDELSAVWSPDLDPSPLVAYSPVDGVPDGLQATLNARFLRRTGPTKEGEFFRKMTVYLECVDDPPVWVLGT